jgi:hypothetical protein
MRRSLSPARPVWIALFAALLALAATASANPGNFFPVPADPLMGDYVGRWSEEEDVDPDIAVQVVPLGNNRYHVIGTAKLDMRATPKFSVEVEAEDGRLRFREDGLEVVCDGQTVTGSRRVGNKRFTANKVERKSPTLGQPAPDGATVLFNGENMDAWDGTTGWELTPDGALMVTPAGKYLISKQAFRDLTLHIEFRTPFMPTARGQQRGNSGVFLYDVYEVQVLDSYGLPGYYDECGALYKLSAPRVNACLPPGAWQTYDIDFRAPRFDANGALTENARITVRHNGVLIQDDVELIYITDWKEKDRLRTPPATPGPVKMQGHNNYVQFRNIWVIPGAE